MLNPRSRATPNDAAAMSVDGVVCRGRRSTADSASCASSRERRPWRTYPAKAFATSSQSRSGATPSDSPLLTCAIHSRARSLPPKAPRTMTEASKATGTFVPSLSDDLLRLGRVGGEFDLFRDPSELFGDLPPPPLPLRNSL